MNDIRKTKNRAFTTMILGFFVCFFMVGMYIITNNVSTSYALPITIDAKDIEEITTATKQIVKNNETGELSYVTLDENYQEPEGYTDWFYSLGDDTYSLATKFVGTINLENGVVYELDMFCLEMNKAIPRAGINYIRDAEYDQYIDEGIIYIINQAYKNVELKDNKIALSIADYYDAQIAIWIYQELKRGDKKFNWCNADHCAEPTTPEAIAAKNQIVLALSQLQNVWDYVQNNHASGETNKIYNYVVGAQAAKASETANEIKIKSGKVELKLTDNKDYYETDLIEVDVTTAVNTEFAGFGFVLNSDEYNTIIVDENGNTINDYSQLANNKFRIRIPASSLKVGEKTTITGDFTARFSKDTYLAYGFNGGVASYQKALLVASTTSFQSIPLKLEVTVPDTGIDYSQYIYIIGAMVLVIGLTVIYVNTKSKEI